MFKLGGALKTEIDYDGLFTFMLHGLFLLNTTQWCNIIKNFWYEFILIIATLSTNVY